MTQEEKAKAYDKALERAMELYENSNGMILKKWLWKVFPELAEQSDERTRKALLHLVNSNKELSFGIDNYDGVKWEDIITWLEKKVCQKSVDKEYTFKSIPRLLDMIEPTDRAKSYCKKLIDSLQTEGYSVDAKIVGECLKQMNGEKVAMAVMDTEKQDEQKPQRMVSAEAKEALYDKPTDEEMKELLRTEYEKGRADTIAEMEKDWSEEDDVMINKLLAVVKLYYDRSGDDLDKQSCISFLKSLKDKVQPQPKQKLSDNEKKMLCNLIAYINNRTDLISEVKDTYVSWLKSLKDRVVPQPKHKWSIEDERVIAIINNALTESNTPPDDYDKVYDWLESLRKRIGE